MMRKSNLFNFLLIAVIAFSFISFMRAICDDDDLPFDLLCRNCDTFEYDSLLLKAASDRTTLCEQHKNIFFLEPFISYLARYEKSPPSVSSS